MANDNDQQQWLINCLAATLNSDEGRKAAEEALQKASVEQGYGVALAKLVVNRDCTFGLRQLAAVLLKQYVKQHWLEGEKDYIPPQTLPDDKVTIRNILPLALGDSVSKIQTAVGMAIATIAKWDWPEEWPDLMVYILGCLNDQSDLNRMHGALKCLALFAGDVDDRQLPHVVPLLFPSLYAIISTPSAYDSSMRQRALNILHSCLATLGIMSGVQQKETKALISPMLKAWMQQFAVILSPPLPSENPEDWGVRMEALKALFQIVQNFSKLASKELPVVLGPLWQTFVSGLSVYQAACVQGLQDSFDGLADSEGGSQGLEAFAVQLFEVVISLVGSSRYSKVVRNSVNDLAYYTIGYMQMTEIQAQAWFEDPNQYVADEEDEPCTCRISGLLLLEEIVTAYAKEGVICILDAVSKRIKEADEIKAQGRADWWKLRESAMFALSSVAELQDKGITGVQGFSLMSFMDSVLNLDLAPGMKACPFLYGRALWASAKFTSAIRKENYQQFFLSAMAGLSQEADAPVMIGACRALSKLLPQLEGSLSPAQLESVFAALSARLEEASEETLFLVLETVQSVIPTARRASIAVEARLSPLLLNVWAKHVADPFISEAVLDVLEAIKNLPGCLEPLTARVLPFLARIFVERQNQECGLVAGALDLLTMLLKTASIEVLQSAYNITFLPVLTLLLQTDDHSELQNATECLTMFVRHGGEKLLTWSSDANMTMRMLLDVAARLLNPDMESSGALFIGPYILQLIQQLSTQMAPYLRDLVTALVIRIESINLKVSLILVFAKLVHMSAPNYGQFIDLLSSVPSKVYGDGLTCVMTEWTNCYSDVTGSYQIKVSTLALAHLLACGHPKLSQISVRGRCLEPAGGGIMTRSRSKTHPELWTTVSLPEKMFCVLVDGLMELQEQTTNGDDTWLTDDDEDDDGDGDDDDDDYEGEVSISMFEKKSVFQPLEDVQHLLNAEVYADGVSDPAEEGDPINQVNLQIYLVEFMQKFVHEAPDMFMKFSLALNERQKAAVQTALGKF